jgi:hypothetical protein
MADLSSRLRGEKEPGRERFELAAMNFGTWD